MSVRGTAPTVVSHVEAVMGTVVSFTLHPGDLDRGRVRPALDVACGLLHQADATFSTWKPDSPLSRLRRGELSPAEVPADVNEVLDACRAARNLTDGWFDPWAMPGGVDPTGLVKGWALDNALGALRSAGMAAALVNGGGDLAGFGCPEPGQAWRVGIRHPWRADALAAVVELRAAVATSGTYERGAHLVDPHDGRPCARAVSATVTGPSLALADAWATALAVAGVRLLPAIGTCPGYDAYVIAQDGTEEATGDFPFTS